MLARGRDECPTKLRIPVVIVAFDSLLEVAQANGQVTWPAEVDDKMPSALPR